MPMLQYFRTNRALFARHTFAVFATVWVMLALQPCAMALKADSSTSSAGTMMMSNMEHPCDHCPEEPTTNECQFDDWGSPNQTLSLTQDIKPAATFDTLLTLMSIALFKPARIDQHRYSEPPTSIPHPSPTLKQDILRC